MLAAFAVFLFGFATASCSEPSATVYFSADGQIVAEAEAKAREIRAEGDAEAAKYYEVFSKNPELAIFLRKLDALSQIMKTRTTLVVDTNTAPFDLLQKNAEILGTK